MIRRTRLSEATLLALIEQIYAAAEDGDRWQPLLVSIADAVAGTAASLISHDLTAAGAVTCVARLDPDVMRLYNEHYHRLDVWALGAGARKLTASGRVLRDEMMAPRRDLERSEYFPFVERYDISRLVHTVLRVDPAGVTGLSLNRAERDPPFDDEIVRFLAHLAPHLERALRIRHLFARAAHERDAVLGGLDALSAGVALVGMDARILHANRAARSVFDRRDGLFLDRGCLTTASPAATSSLRGLCAACAQTTRGDGTHAGGAVTVPRPSGLRSFQLVVAPVRQREPLGVRHDGAVAAVFIADPEEPPASSDAYLAERFRLTPLEARVAQALARGQSVTVIADSLHLTHETTRWYVKQVLAKTDTSRQAELVRLLLTMALPLVEPEDG